jgi:hypothetical protein
VNGLSTRTGAAPRSSKFLGSDIGTRHLASFDILAFQEIVPILKMLRPPPQSGMRLPPSSYSSQTLLQPSPMTRFNAGLDAEACRLWKGCRRQEMGIGTGRQRSANRWKICSEILDQTAESEYVGCSRDCGPDVPCQIGSRVSRKGFGFERGKGRDLNNEPLCWPPRIPPCQTFSPTPCNQDACFQRHSKTEATQLDDRKPLVRRRLKEDLIRSDICVHNRSQPGT